MKPRFQLRIKSAGKSCRIQRTWMMRCHPSIFPFKQRARFSFFSGHVFCFHILLLHCIIIKNEATWPGGSNVSLKASRGWRSGVRSLPPAICIFSFVFRKSGVHSSLRPIMDAHQSTCQMAGWPDLVVSIKGPPKGQSTHVYGIRKVNWISFKWASEIAFYTPKIRPTFYTFLLFCLFHLFILFIYFNY